MNNKKVIKELELGGRKLTLTTGELANLASGAVMAQYGETVVLATVVASKMTQDLGYFPLSVDYQERLYAGGRIKGSRWVKREGRPTDDEILTARLIDRSIRPLFPKEYEGYEVQVIVMALSVDMENDPKILGSIAASAALAISPIPWMGPVGTIQVGLKDDKYLVNPLDSDMEESTLNLVVSSTDESVVMIEAGADEVPGDKVVEGIEFAKKESKILLDALKEFAEEVGNKKETVEKPKVNEDLKKKIASEIKPQLDGVIKAMAGHEGDDKEIKSALVEKFADDDPKEILAIYEKLFKTRLREMILSGKRADGRGLTDIRALSSRVGVLPRTHGSAIFNRGKTQVLNVTTLGSPSMGQLIETAEGEEEKRYIHHYSFPPYCVGETGRVGSPKRREIGHGALAERALLPVIPDEKEFPYTIRVVSEVTSSNGSSSMASTCGSTLSLMDAGVPIKRPVSGIAMGVIVESEKEYSVLSDIMGIEDFGGDMDFKVTGTQKGVTALQLDVKTLKLTPKILKEAMAQAEEGRGLILKSMLKTINEPNKSLSAFAPKIKSITIPTDKIGELIGPGGKNIKKIMAETDTQVDVDDNGVVAITGIDEEKVDTALETVEAITKEVEINEIYEGEVVRIENYGAFVNILPGKDGLVHVSDMSDSFVEDPNTIVKMGDKVKVRVSKIDMGKIGLSMNLDPESDKKKQESRRNNSRNSGGRRSYDSRRSGGRKPYSRNSRSRNDRRSDSGKSSGPHFPTSRYFDNNKSGR